jgi:hypothetical protein
MNINNRVKKTTLDGAFVRLEPLGAKTQARAIYSHIRWCFI